jgi:nucleoside-diphosphate-sugar epimerase
MFFKDKKVLVTGGAGVIGQELIAMLKEQGAAIRCIDLQEKPRTVDGVEYFRLDLADPDGQFLFRFEPEYVFHLAADFERSEEQLEFWESNFRNNVLASHYLIREAVRSKALKKFIFASSYLVYDKRQYQDVRRIHRLREDARILPRNLCGAAKLQTEMDLEFLSRHNHKPFDFAAARIFRVYGRGSRDVLSRWVNDILDGNRIVVFSENNRFDLIFSRDVAAGLLKLAETRNATGIFNLGTGRAPAISEAVAILKKSLPSVDIKRIDKVIFPESSCADISRLKSTLRWQPEIDLEAGIREIIEFEKLRHA